MQATREEIESIVREVALNMFAPILGMSETSVNPDQWIALTDAWENLGYPSYSALYKAVNSGVFRIGKEVRDRRKPGSKRPVSQINLTLAHKRLNEHHAKRRVV